MLFLIVLLCLCQINNIESTGKDGTLSKPFYGPSYQPNNWSASTAFKSLRSGDFNYTDPGNWPNYFPECGGKHQSPINIETEELIKRKTKKPLKWTNYSELPNKMLIQNSLHSVHIYGEWENSRTPFITNGPFDDRYYFSQLHFHWGSNDEEGSEHTVNKKRYPLEMHIVHDRGTEDWENSKDENNLVVVTFMFEIISEDNPVLPPILDEIEEVAGSEVKQVAIDPFVLDEVIEPFHGKYVTYSGSLTTPPCSENVTWVIGSKPIGISEKQIEILRNSIRNYEDNKPIRNFRPVQQLNERKVYYIIC